MFYHLLENILKKDTWPKMDDFRFEKTLWIFYDLKEVQFFMPDSSQLQNFRNSEQFHHEEEKIQTLWQRYFCKTGIPERKNMKLHIQWVPNAIEIPHRKVLKQTSKIVLKGFYIYFLKGVCNSYR